MTEPAHFASRPWTRADDDELRWLRPLDLNLPSPLTSLNLSCHLDRPSSSDIFSFTAGAARRAGLARRSRQIAQAEGGIGRERTP
jgi:hypothetical protein